MLQIVVEFHFAVQLLGREEGERIYLKGVFENVNMLDWGRYLEWEGVIYCFG